MSLRLIIEDDEGTTTIVPLGIDEVTIGRQQGNTIQLTEKNVSRHHARLYPESDVWVIEDLGSYNGVKVNGREVDGRVTLTEGDVVQIADYHLALTENAEQKSLNFPASGQHAANDPHPMLASSSTDLPRLTAEELAVLQSSPSGQNQPLGRDLVDSGPVPAAPPVVYQDEETTTSRGGSGLLIGLGVLAVGAVVVGGWWLTRAEADPEASPSEVATEDKGRPTNPAPAEAREPKDATKAAPPPHTDDGEPSDSDVGSEDPQTAKNPAPESPPRKPTPVLQPPQDGTGAPDDTGTPRPRKRQRKPRAPKKAAPKPTKPAVDADALLQEAQVQLLQRNHQQAYSLAKKSYQAKRQSTAAAVMASAACKMGDASKAKYALSRLSGQTRERMAKICRSKGIEV